MSETQRPLRILRRIGAVLAGLLTIIVALHHPKCLPARGIAGRPKLAVEWFLGNRGSSIRLLQYRVGFWQLFVAYPPASLMSS